MRYKRSRAVVLTVMTAHLALTVLALGQEVTKKADPPPDLKKGDEVIALRNAELKVGETVVGAVRKGEKLNVKDVKDNWLLVSHGDVQGWIEGTSVMGATLKAWFVHHADISVRVNAVKSVGDFLGQATDRSGRAKDKLLGVTFEVVSLKPKSRPSVEYHTSGTLTAEFLSIPPHRVSNGVYVGYGLLAIVLEKLDEHRSALSVNATACGEVQQGDHVFINKSSCEVFVNGELRRKVSPVSTAEEQREEKRLQATRDQGRRKIDEAKRMIDEMKRKLGKDFTPEMEREMEKTLKEAEEAIEN